MPNNPDLTTFMDNTDKTNNEELLLKRIEELVKEYASTTGHTYSPMIRRYRASGVPYCNRKIALEMLLGLEELETLEEDEALMGTAMTGQLIHDFLEKALEPILISSEEEVEIDFGEFKITGHYDLLVTDVDGSKVVIDVKTCSDASKIKPKESHKRQLSIYQAALGGIPGALLYVERNNFQMKLFRFDFDKELFSQVASKIAALNASLLRVAEHFGMEKEVNSGSPFEINLNFEEVKEAMDLGLLPPAVPEFEYECRNSWSKCRFYDLCHRDS